MTFPFDRMVVGGRGGCEWYVFSVCLPHVGWMVVGPLVWHGVGQGKGCGAWLGWWISIRGMWNSSFDPEVLVDFNYRYMCFVCC